MRKIWFILLGLVAMVILGIGIIFTVPSLRESSVFQINKIRTQVKYALAPPQEAVSWRKQLATMVQATMQAKIPSPTPTLTPTTAEATAAPTQTPTLTPTPLPSAVTLDGVRYIDQHGLWNYCAPSTLAMALTYWGWEGDRTDVGQVVKPFDKDKNVMPYELEDYVNTHTQFKALVRAGGDLDLLKRLVAEEFVVIVEKGIMLKDYNGKLGWVGHYTVVNGYDDAKQQFMTQDAYYSADYPVGYEELLTEWRGFNYTYLVIYPAGQEEKVLRALGPSADTAAGYRIAAQGAGEGSCHTHRVQQFFAYLITAPAGQPSGYTGAASAYDKAFQLMAALPESDRPWRIMWYQTGPYFAYYFTGRYADVIKLADNTIFYASEPYLEESFIWRARAYAIQGNTGAAETDTARASSSIPVTSPRSMGATARHSTVTPSHDKLLAFRPTPYR